LRAVLVDDGFAALCGEGIEIEHGLDIEELHGSFKHASIISYGNFIERKVIL
jgi:hypothetical protein